MKVWQRAARERRCGSCSQPIYAGQPLQEISSPHGHPWRMVRCKECADGVPPADLPELPVHPTVTPQAKTRSTWTKVGDMRMRMGKRKV